MFYNLDISNCRGGQREVVLKMVRPTHCLPPNLISLRVLSIKTSLQNFPGSLRTAREASSFWRQIIAQFGWVIYILKGRILSFNYRITSFFKQFPSKRITVNWQFILAVCWAPCWSYPLAHLSYLLCLPSALGVWPFTLQGWSFLEAAKSSPCWCSHTFYWEILVSQPALNLLSSGLTLSPFTSVQPVFSILPW